jgi:hypothetical protein
VAAARATGELIKLIVLAKAGLRPARGVNVRFPPIPDNPLNPPGGATVDLGQAASSSFACFS